MFELWQLWAVALGSGLITLALRAAPILAFRDIGEGRLRDILDRTGFGVMGGIVAQNALSTGRAAFAHEGGAEMQALGMAWGVAAVGVAFLLAVRFKWKLPAALCGLAFFGIGGAIFAG